MCCFLASFCFRFVGFPIKIEALLPHNCIVGCWLYSAVLRIASCPFQLHISFEMIMCFNCSIILCSFSIPYLFCTLPWDVVHRRWEWSAFRCFSVLHMVLYCECVIVLLCVFFLVGVVVLVSPVIIVFTKQKRLFCFWVFFYIFFIWVVHVSAFIPPTTSNPNN